MCRSGFENWLIFGRAIDRQLDYRAAGGLRGLGRRVVRLGGSGSSFRFTDLFLALVNFALAAALLYIFNPAHGAVEHDVGFTDGGENLVIGTLRLLSPHHHFTAFAQLLFRHTGLVGFGVTLEVEE